MIINLFIQTLLKHKFSTYFSEKVNITVEIYIYFKACDCVYFLYPTTARSDPPGWKSRERHVWRCPRCPARIATHVPAMTFQSRTLSSLEAEARTQRSAGEKRRS